MGMHKHTHPQPVGSWKCRPRPKREQLASYSDY